MRRSVCGVVFGSGGRTDSAKRSLASSAEVADLQVAQLAGADVAAAEYLADDAAADVAVADLSAEAAQVEADRRLGDAEALVDLAPVEAQPPVRPPNRIGPSETSLGSPGAGC